MKLSELITEAQETLLTFGDIDVVYKDKEWNSYEDVSCIEVQRIEELNNPIVRHQDSFSGGKLIGVIE